MCLLAKIHGGKCCSGRIYQRDAAGRRGGSNSRTHTVDPVYRQSDGWRRPPPPAAAAGEDGPDGGLSGAVLSGRRSKARTPGSATTSMPGLQLALGYSPKDPNSAGNGHPSAVDRSASPIVCIPEGAETCAYRGAGRSVREINARDLRNLEILIVPAPFPKAGRSATCGCTLTRKFRYQFAGCECRICLHHPRKKYGERLQNARTHHQSNLTETPPAHRRRSTSRAARTRV